MKRICLFINLFYFTLTSVNGQVRFSKFYDYNHTANLISDVVVLSDTGYFTVSECVDFNSKEADQLRAMLSRVYENMNAHSTE